MDKVNIEPVVQQPSFTPINITITVESEKELRELWTIFNAPPYAFESYKGTVGKAGDSPDTYQYWTAINKYIKSLEGES